MDRTAYGRVFGCEFQTIFRLLRGAFQNKLRTQVPSWPGVQRLQAKLAPNHGSVFVLLKTCLLLGPNISVSVVVAFEVPWPYFTPQGVSPRWDVDYHGHISPRRVFHHAGMSISTVSWCHFGISKAHTSERSQKETSMDRKCSRQGRDFPGNQKWVCTPFCVPLYLEIGQCKNRFSVS